MISESVVDEENKTATKIQRIDNGIESQKMVLQFSGDEWRNLLQKARDRGLFSPKEMGILQIATQIPRKIPSEKQSMILVGLLNRAEQEGIVMNMQNQ